AFTFGRRAVRSWLGDNAEIFRWIHAPMADRRRIRGRNRQRVFARARGKTNSDWHGVRGMDGRRRNWHRASRNRIIRRAAHGPAPRLHDAHRRWNRRPAAAFSTITLRD